MKIKLLPIGAIYNNLTIIDNTHKVKKSSACVCMCSCGKITKPIQNYCITSGNTKSCGCLGLIAKSKNGKANFGKPSKLKGLKLIELLKPGTIFGNLTIISLFGQTKCGHDLYNCLCSCGNTKVINKSHLLSGQTKSCGCLRVIHILKVKRNYRISKGFDPDILMTPVSILERNKLEELHKQVKIRDNFTCLLCGCQGGILHAHHIIPFSKNIEQRNNLSNLITLCKNCHINKAHNGHFTKLNEEIQSKLQNCVESLY